MRKPALQKVREKIMSSLLHMPDADLAEIATVCNGLLNMRNMAKGQAVRKTISEAVRDAVETGSGFTEMPPLPHGTSPRPNSQVPQLLDSEDSA